MKKRKNEEMPKSETTKPDYENRNLLVSRLATKFSNEHLAVMQHYTSEQQIELTDHLLLMLDEINALAQRPEDKTIHKGYANREDALVKKYRTLFQPFHSIKFFQYFYFDCVLAEKEIVSTDEYNAMEMQEISAEEVEKFVWLCKNGLNYYLQRLYLYTPPENIQQTQFQGIANSEAALDLIQTTDKEATQAKQLLAIYYLLKVGFNVVAREKHPVSDIARIAHLLTGTKLKPLNKSEIYSKLLKMPNYKKGAELIKDLLYIRSYFDIAGLEQIRQQIDDDIASANGNSPK